MKLKAYVRGGGEGEGGDVREGAGDGGGVR